MKARHLRNITLIVLIRKKVRKLMVRSKPWLKMIPANRSDSIDGDMVMFLIPTLLYKDIRYFSYKIGVGYHLPFQHNELGHLPYMAAALIPRAQSRSVWQSTNLRPEEPFLLLKYILTLSLILRSYYCQSLVNTCSCKYNFFSSYRVVCLFITTTFVH